MAKESGAAAHGFLDPKESCLGPLGAIASFSDALSIDDELARALTLRLHERTCVFLKDVLPAPRIQHVSHRRMSRIDDMAEIMTFMQGLGGPPQTTSVETAGVPAAAAAPAAIGAEPQHAVKSNQVGEARSENELVLDPLPDGSTKVVVDAEDMVGLTAHINGEPVLFESVLGKGRHKVVFGLTNLQTGRRSALAMALSSFGPEAKLRTYLEQALRGQSTCEPDVLLSLCEAVLARCPLDQTAAYNKGNALVAKGSFHEAIDAFDVVLAVNPDDLDTLICKAHALCCLGRHFMAVTLLARACDLYQDDFCETLRGHESTKARISASLREVLREQPDCIDAQQLARALAGRFGDDPAMRSPGSGCSR